MTETALVVPPDKRLEVPIVIERDPRHRETCCLFRIRIGDRWTPPLCPDEVLGWAGIIIAQELKLSQSHLLLTQAEHDAREATFAATNKAGIDT